MPPLELEFSQIPLQPLLRGGASILAAHFGPIGYLVPLQEHGHSQLRPPKYRKNENVWEDIIGRRVFAGQEITLEGFQVMDWFHEPQDCITLRALPMRARRPTISFTLN
jgi:hypothetical protein